MPHLALLLTVGHGFDALSDSVNGLLERVFGRLHEVFTVLNFFFNYYLFKNIFKLFFYLNGLSPFRHRATHQLHISVGGGPKELPSITKKIQDLLFYASKSREISKYKDLSMSKIKIRKSVIKRSASQRLTQKLFYR